MNKLLIIPSISLLMLIAACSSAKDVGHVLKAGENDLKTGEDLLTQFHSVLYYPSEINLNFPGFIVGIEKSPVKLIMSSKNDVVTTDIKNSGENAKGYKKRLIDKKIMFISHVVQNYGQQYGKGNCALYNAYYRGSSNIPAPINFCSDSNIEEIKNKEAYVKSWNAIDLLKEKVNAQLDSGDFTHILVVSMGWNTAQEEAVRNFNSIVKNIKNSSPQGEFNPLFIGVTWPSMWDNAWFDPIYKGTSYTVKANDADEVGFSWLGAVLHHSINGLNKKLPIIVLGHSFGARATSMASCVGSAISKDNTFKERNKIDLLISLQGAYSVNRFFSDQGIEGISYPEHCSKNVSKVVLTSSKYDSAIDTGKWVPSVGNDKTFNDYCKNEDQNYIESSEYINCADITETQGISSNKNNKPILYLNGDSLIKYKSYMTGGDAHSDIYRKEMGRLLWNVINQYGKKI